MTTTATTAERTPSRDPYARIAELDHDTVAALAERLELRAADPGQHELWRSFLARAPIVESARVLDVGCGSGILTAKLAEHPGVAETVGVDPSPYLVDRARRRAPSIRFEVADGRALPFPDASFDGVLFATTLCHVPGPDRALAEARRVLRAGGYLLVYEGDYASTTVAGGPHDPLQACVEAAVESLVHDPWLVRRLVPLVRAAGFEPAGLHVHGHVEEAAPGYLSSFVDRGADTLAERGAITAATAAALRAEARDRAAAGRFLGRICYASLLAHVAGR
jgi:ubiquinone/menaquinone biosynthesis C-methylase UbiE